MNNIKVLDTTLRDGGRIINNAFPDEHIAGIAEGLTAAGVDIIEMGFLRGNVVYQGNSTYFDDMEQMKRFIPKDHRNTMYVAFVDYGKEFGMWDFSKLKDCDGSTITGIRLALRKYNYKEALDICHLIKDKGYKLFIQGVESLNYNDSELLEFIDAMNKLRPSYFGIVDTFGAMQKKDVLHLYDLINNNLDEEIHLDFHSHNNQQLSFSFAQEIIEANAGKRPLIIDGTLEGIGRGTGNLNLELIMEHLNRNYSCLYNLDYIFDTIDEYITWIKKDHSWGYSIPHFMSALFNSHPNNVMYLLDKHKLDTKDIRYVLSMIEPEKRKIYDYDNIEKKYIEYTSSKVDDSAALSVLHTTLAGRKILILVPGSSLVKYEREINEVIKTQDPVVISVNFIDPRGNDRFSFFGNPRRYQRCRAELDDANTIITSNIHSNGGNTLVVNYNSLINRGVKYFDNSTLMLLNLLRRVGCEELMIAGFDGFREGGKDNYVRSMYNPNIKKEEYEHLNADISKLLRDFAKTLENKKSVKFITPSRFEGAFDESLQ